MAFFDDDPPTQQRRSSAPPPPPRPPRPPRDAVDPAQIWARRGVAVGAIIVVFAILALFLNGCVTSAKKNALSDYGQAVTDIGTESTSNVAQGLQLLSQPNEREALAQRNALDKLASDSRALTQKARDLSTPGGLEGATQNLVTALSLRADALARIADRVATARGTSRAQAEQATEQIAGQMQSLLASDVLWQLRVTPYILDRAKELDTRSDDVESSVVMTDLTWLNASSVANKIDGQSEQTDTQTAVAPGTHGHGIQSVTANGKALAVGQPLTVSAASGLSFVVTIANQGENDETNVSVTVTGTSKATGKQVFAETRKIPQSRKGTTTPVTIPITSPPSGAVTITTEVKPVGGEVNKDNNKQTFQVIFS